LTNHKHNVIPCSNYGEYVKKCQDLLRKGESWEPFLGKCNREMKQMISQLANCVIKIIG